MALNPSDGGAGGTSSSPGGEIYVCEDSCKSVSVEGECD